MTFEQYLPWILIGKTVDRTGQSVFIWKTIAKALNGWFVCTSSLYPLKEEIGFLFRDITERKKAEEALKQSEEQLRVEERRLSLIYNNVPETLYSLSVEPNNNFRFTSINQAFLDTTGLHENQVVGKSVKEVIPEPSLTMVLEKYNQAIKEKKAVRWEEVTNYPAGKKYGEVTVAPLFDSKGHCINLIGNVHDITERKHAEQALKEDKERYRQLFSSMTEMFFVAELLYGETGEVVDFVYSEANPAFANSLGKRSEEVVGKRAKELFGGVGMEDFWFEELSSVNKTAKAFNAEQSSKRTGKLYEVFVWKIKENRIGVIFDDITQRKGLEKQSQDNERMAAIGQTAGMVGHDIRNPLQAIVSELFLARQVMAEAPKNPDTTEVLESINVIQEQVDYINKIVSDLQDYARPLNPEYSIVNLPDLLVSVFDAIVLPDKIKLNVDVKGTLKLKTDPTFIRRAITNLANNAIQAMPDGGELGLAAQKQEDCVVICVSDTGQGIPEHVKANLFKPLTTTKSKGQGLGLAVVKRLVEGLNGKVSFESEEGKGTKFILELPFVQ